MNITDQLAQALEACHPSKVWEMARMYYTNTVSREDPYIQWHEDRCRQVGVALSAYRASKEGEKVELTYWAIIGGYTGHVIGVCTEKSDVLAEEPLATFVQITEEQFEAYRSDSDTLDHLSRRPIRAT